MNVMRRVISTWAPASAIVIGGGYYFRDDLRSFAATTIVEPANDVYHNFAVSNHHYRGVPWSSWNDNWDNREPLMLVDEAKYKASTDEEKAAILKKVTPTATRHIFLIRHGQYHFHNDQQNLTDLGREQALHLGMRMASSKIKFDKVTMSTMTRAKETAQIMLTQLDKSMPTHLDSMLEEGAPYPPEPPHSQWRPFINEYFVDGSRIEAAFRKYFYRASPKQKEDSYEVIVCHANVIRYFVCRALQFPPEGWLRISLGHTSISWLTIRPNGYVSLRSLGDVGHLPSEKITFSKNPLRDQRRIRKSMRLS